MALLTGEPRSATATASTEVELLLLRKDDFDALVRTNSSITRGMLRIMVERQATMNMRLTQEVGAIAGEVHGLVTVVFAARGGAGQTTLATNLAVALAQATPDRVVIVDLDLLFGHVAMLLDMVPRTALAAITPAALRQLDRDSLAFYISVHEESSLRLMSGALRPEESELVTGEHVRAALDQLRRFFVHVIVDAGSRFSEPALAAVEAADEVVLVGTPEPPAVHALAETERVLRDVLGVPTARMRVVLNRVQPYGDTTAARAAVSSARVSEVPYGGEDVGKAALEGTPLVTTRAGNPAARAILALAREVERAGKEAVALGPGA
jgi:pilus assembly protein CpaE